MEKERSINCPRDNINLWFKKVHANVLCAVNRSQLSLKPENDQDNNGQRSRYDIKVTVRIRLKSVIISQVLVEHCINSSKQLGTNTVLCSCDLHPSEQGLLGIALELGDYLPLHRGAAGLRAGHTVQRRVAAGQGLKGGQITG